MIRHYDTLEIKVGQPTSEGFSVFMSGPGGSTSQTIKPIENDPSLAGLLERLHRLDLDKEGAKELGEHLFQLLFQGPIKDIYHRSQGTLDSSRGLRLAFVIEPLATDIAALPWE